MGRRNFPVLAAIALFGAFACVESPSFAFNYGEHHDLGAAAIRKLAPADRERLAAEWKKVDGNGHTCAGLSPALAADRANATCIDVADLPALAADHACSVDELTNGIREHDWTLKVVARAMRARRDLQRHDAEFMQLWRQSDLDLDLIDHEYGSRASANDAHFALPRGTDELPKYVDESLDQDAPPINAVGLYATFHAAALRLAKESQVATDPKRADSLRTRAILSEAFAIHFLEDLFSSGHIVGTFGSVATKKGTHDEYCRRGLDVRTWGGISYEAHGDAYMTDTDVERGSAAVATSFAQLVAAFSELPETSESASGMSLASAELAATLNVCSTMTMKKGVVPRSVWPLIEEVLSQTPVPARKTTLLPRFDAEVGLFFGVWTGARGVANFTAPGKHAAAPGYGTLELALRLGVNLQDVVGPGGDGQFFLEVGTSVGTQTVAVNRSDPHYALGSTRLVPFQANKFALRMPFAVIPGDLLLAVPVLLPFAPKLLERMALVAAYGGLVPWQRPLHSPVGIVQFVLGRKIDFYLAPNHQIDVYAAGASRAEVITYGTYAFSFPLVEWSPLRRYASSDAFGFKVQVGGGVEVPYGARLASNNEEVTGIPIAGQVFLSFGLWGHRYL